MHQRIAASCLLLTCLLAAQSPAPVVVPVAEEPAHHLAFENEYVRVFKVEVAPHAATLMHRHDKDYVFVTLGDSEVISERQGEKPVTLKLKDGETRFTQRRLCAYRQKFAGYAVSQCDRGAAPACRRYASV
jgi:hypothetical protein